MLFYILITKNILSYPAHLLNKYLYFIAVFMSMKYASLPIDGVRWLKTLKAFDRLDIFPFILLSDICISKQGENVIIFCI